MFRLWKLYEGKCVSIPSLCDDNTIFEFFKKMQSRIYNTTPHILMLDSPCMDELKILTIVKEDKNPC